MLESKYPTYERCEMELKKRIGLSGDWHGNTMWAVAALKGFHLEGVDTVYHVGDFGFWPGNEGKKFLRAMERQLVLYNITLYVTLGNHEDYPQVEALPVSEDGLRWATKHIAVFPRGYRWEVDGVSFVSLGGAPSINFTDLKKGISWWPEEALTMGDIYRLSESSAGFPRTDVMITHDAPDGIPPLDALMAGNASEWNEEGIQYAEEGRKLMNAAVEIVKPQMFVHGHYHYDYVVNVEFGEEEKFMTTVVGLNRDTYKNNNMILDLNTMKTEWIKTPNRLELEFKGNLRT
jgi:hypothetical protein